LTDGGCFFLDSPQQHVTVAVCSPLLKELSLHRELQNQLPHLCDGTGGVGELVELFEEGF
jgi:hypothetical protein